MPSRLEATVKSAGATEEAAVILVEDSSLEGESVSGSIPDKDARMFRSPKSASAKVSLVVS